MNLKFLYRKLLANWKVEKSRKLRDFRFCDKNIVKLVSTCYDIDIINQCWFYKMENFIISIIIALALFVVGVYLEYALKIRDRWGKIDLSWNVVALIISIITITMTFFFTEKSMFDNTYLTHSYVESKDVHHYTTSESRGSGKSKHTVTVYHSDYYVTMHYKDTDIYTSRHKSESWYPDDPDAEWISTNIGDLGVVETTYSDYLLGTSGYNTRYMYNEMSDFSRSTLNGHFRTTLLNSAFLKNHEHEYQQRLQGSAYTVRVYEHQNHPDLKMLDLSYTQPKLNEVVLHIVVQSGKIIEIVPVTYGHIQDSYQYSLLNDGVQSVEPNNFYETVVAKSLNALEISDGETYSYLKDVKPFPMWMWFIVAAIGFVGIFVSLNDELMNEILTKR